MNYYCEYYILQLFIILDHFLAVMRQRTFLMPVTQVFFFNKTSVCYCAFDFLWLCKYLC